MVAGGPGGTMGMTTAMPPPMHPSPMNHQMMSPMMSSPAPPLHAQNNQAMPYRTQMASPHAPMMTSPSMGPSMMASPLAGAHQMHPSTSMAMMPMAPTTSMMQQHRPPTSVNPSTYQQSMMGPPTTSSPAMGNPMMMGMKPPPGGAPSMQHSPHMQQQNMQQPPQQQHLKETGMPRKPKDPSAPPPPKRVRKTKKETAAAAAAEAKAAAGMMETAYDPLMASNGMMLMDDVYASHDGSFVGYYGNGFEPVSYAATSTPSTMTPTSSGSGGSLPPGGPGHQLTPSSTPGSMQGAPGMRPGPGGMGTPTPVGLPPNGGPPLQQHQMPTPSAIEFRIHDMNRRFYLFLNTGVQEKDYTQWWDAFSHEFFDDDAKMTFVLLDNVGKPTEKFVIGRQLIPRYFRTLLDGGMNELYYVIKGPSRETTTPDGMTTYECSDFMQVSKYEQPYQSEVQTDANIKLEFTQYEELYNYRIRNWHIELRQSQEFTYNHINRAFTPLNIDPSRQRQIINGMSPATHQALKFSVILEPMQMIMSTCKGQPQLTPQDALKRICFARHQHQQQQQQAILNAQQAQLMQQQQQPVEETKAKPTRKRTRKAPANPKGAKKGAAAVGAIQSPAPSVPGGAFVAPQGIPPQSMHYGGGVPEVFVVGEPSMLGGEFREDERQIDKLENPNYDPNAAMRHPPGGPPPGMMAPPHMQPGPATMQQMQAHHQQQLQQMGGPSPQGQPGQPPTGPHPHHLMGGPHGNMGPPMMPQQQQQMQQGVPTPPGAGGMPNGLQPQAGYEYNMAGWSRPPTNHLLA